MSHTSCRFADLEWSGLTLPLPGCALLATLTTPSIVWLGLLCLGAIGMAAWSRGGASALRATKIRLTAQHELHIVELDGRRLVIATGPAAAPSLLCELGLGREQRAQPDGPAQETGAVHRAAPVVQAATTPAAWAGLPLTSLAARLHTRVTGRRPLWVVPAPEPTGPGTLQVGAEGLQEGVGLQSGVGEGPALRRSLPATDDSAFSRSSVDTLHASSTAQCCDLMPPLAERRA